MVRSCEAEGNWRTAASFLNISDIKRHNHPTCLREQPPGCLKRLGVARIDRWQWHRIDPRKPRQAQFETVRSLLDDGIIRHAGRSEATVRDLEEAQTCLPIATVKNRYNPGDRQYEDALRLLRAPWHRFYPAVPADAQPWF